MEFETLQRVMYILIIIIMYFNNDYGLVKVYIPFRICHQVKYTDVMSERSLKIFLRIDSRQLFPVRSLLFDSLYINATDLTGKKLRNIKKKHLCTTHIFFSLYNSNRTLYKRNKNYILPTIFVTYLCT